MKKKSRPPSTTYSLQSKSAVFIGRFQPFHRGHLNVVKDILTKEKHLIITVGSAQYHFQPENPFTASERIEMIKAALIEAKIDSSRYCIIPIWNIEDYKNWPNHVDNIVPSYETIYTGSRLTKRLYEEQKKHRIKSVKLYGKISATLIRKNMLAGKKWEQYLPKAVTKLLKKWDAINRLKDIQ